MFGKLTWQAIPFDQPLPMISSTIVAVVIIGVLGWVVWKGHLPYLWREWITSVDHKRIGVMYTLLALVMLLRGFADCGCTMADIHAADAAREIEERISIHIVQDGAFSPRDENWRGRMRSPRHGTLSPLPPANRLRSGYFRV